MNLLVGRYSRSWLLAAIAIGIFGVLLAQPSTSSATFYEFSSCDVTTQDDGSFGTDWETSGLGYFAGSAPKVDCPTGIRFDINNPVAQGVKGVAWFVPYSDSVIKSVKFKYYGGDASGQYAYTVRSCGAGCDQVTELDVDGSPSLKSVTAVMPAVVLPEEWMNPGPASVAIQIECKVAICADPPELVAKDFRFVYDDDVSPEVTDLVTDPEDALGASGATGDPTSAKWIRGENFKAAYRITDAGSGTMDSYLGVDTKIPKQVSPVSCSRRQGARICDSYLDVDTSVDIRGLADGEHSLKLSADDSALSTPLQHSYPFFVDNTAPGEPTGLNFAGVSQWGWTSDASLAISHDDASLDPRNTEHSGFGAAKFDIRPSPNSDPEAVETVLDPAAPAELSFPHEGEWDAGVTYGDGAGNSGNRAHDLVGFDTTTPQPPDPDPLGWISLEQLRSGVEQTWTPPPADSQLESGICAYAFAVDDDPQGIPEPNPDVLAPETSAGIRSDVGEGNHFAHVRSIACNGKASTQESVAVDVDGSPPTVSLYGLSSNEWMTSQPTVSLSATDTLSGVAGLEYEFNGAGSPALIPGSSASISIPQGARSITYRAIDAVGNSTPAVERAFKADWTPPTATFEPRDPTQPNVLTADVSDAHSGLAGVGMQIRRTDSGASAIESNWRTLGEFETLSDAGAKDKKLTRAVPDGQLADGTYAVRVNARDIAGNWSEASSELSLTLPVRAKPALSPAIAMISKRGKVNWSGASQDRVVTFGKKCALVGSLLDPAGNPIADARISVVTTPQFGTPGTPHVVTTDARGEFVLRLPNGPTRRFDLHFDGNSRSQPIDQTADIRVRAALDFKVSKKTVRSGERFKLSGRLLSKGIGLPEGGKIVTIRFLKKRTWMPTYATPPVDSQGRFKYTSYDGITAARKTTVYFQVTAIRDGSWPFLSGSSKIIALRIKP